MRRYFMLELEKQSEYVNVYVDTYEAGPLLDKVKPKPEAWQDYFGDEADEWGVVGVTELTAEEVSDETLLPGVIVEPEEAAMKLIVEISKLLSRTDEEVRRRLAADPACRQNMQEILSVLDRVLQ